VASCYFALWKAASSVSSPGPSSLHETKDLGTQLLHPLFCDVLLSHCAICFVTKVCVSARLWLCVLREDIPPQSAHLCFDLLKALLPLGHRNPQGAVNVIAEINVLTELNLT